MEGCHTGINQPQLVQRQETLVMGIELRTTNRQEMNPDTAGIPQLWHQFLTERQPSHDGVAPSQSPLSQSPLSQSPSSQSPPSEAQPVYGVYTDYASDELGEYSLILATEVSSIDNPPEHQVGIAIPSGCYLLFEGSGDPAAAAIQTWRQIWHYFRHNSPYQRAFTTDFELYEPQQTSIYIAVRAAAQQPG